MSMLTRRCAIWALVGLGLAVSPALVRSQHRMGIQSTFNSDYVQSKSSQRTLESTFGQMLFVGQSQSGSIQILSGYYAIKKPRAAALALDETGQLPTEYALRQNYPNPFNPSTTIAFDLPKVSEVILVVYDLLGHEVVRLINGHQEPGYAQVSWHGKDTHGREVPAGIYIARLLVSPQAGVTPEYVQSIKMVLLK